MYKRSKNRIKRSVFRKEIDSFVLIGKRDAIFAQKGSARLINLCEMPKLQRKHTFLRLTIYIYRGALLQAKWPGLVHSTNPPRLVHLIWGWPYRRYSRLRICVGKKKLNYRRGSCASYFRSLPIDRALSIFYAMKCPDTNGGAAASARSPLYDFDENSKLQRPGKGDIRPFYIEKWQRGHSNRLITSTVLGFEIVIYTYIYIYIFFLFFFFYHLLSLVRMRFQRDPHPLDLAVKMFVKIYFLETTFMENICIGNACKFSLEHSFREFRTRRFFQIYSTMGTIGLSDL